MTLELALVLAGICMLLWIWHWISAQGRKSVEGRLNPIIQPSPEEAKEKSAKVLDESAQALAEAAGAGRLGGIYAPWLSRAGAYHRHAGIYYVSGKILLMLAAAVGFVWSGDAGAWNSPQRIAELGFLAVGLWFLPDGFLYLHIRERQQKLQKSLPYWLDLHTTLVEGGLGFDAALARIVEETRQVKDVIFQELAVVHKEMVMGLDRITAFRRMAQRTKVDDLEQVVAALVQADRLGTGVVTALRAQADMVRNKVWEKARANAEKLPTKLLFPIFIGIMPMYFVLVILPLFLRIVAGLKGMR
jgi:tight adherence protein C